MVTGQNEYKDDVSEAYYDTEARLKTQQTKLDRLHALLEQAATMEDIIALETALSETELQIEYLTGKPSPLRQPHRLLHREPVSQRGLQTLHGRPGAGDLRPAAGRRLLHRLPPGCGRPGGPGGLPGPELDGPDSAGAGFNGGGGAAAAAVEKKDCRLPRLRQRTPAVKPDSQIPTRRQRVWIFA